MKGSIKKKAKRAGMQRPVQAKIRSGFLMLKLPLQEPKISKSGKTKVIATTGGLKRIGVRFNGVQEIYVVANACIYEDESHVG